MNFSLRTDQLHVEGIMRNAWEASCRLGIFQQWTDQEARNTNDRKVH